MTNKLFFYTLLFILLAYNLNYSQELTPTQIYDKVNNSVVMIVIHFFGNDTLTQGSGVVVDEFGIILSNYHLIDNKNEIQNIYIIHREDTISNVRIIGSDKDKDILILKISDKSFTPISWSSNNSLTIGEVVYTISSPKGLENTFSKGIISGLNRKLDNLMPLIQFSADVQQGSSGGALINSKGELIGVIVAKYLNSFLNFAIPINNITEAYNKANMFIVQQKLDVINPEYMNRINLYIEDLSDTTNFLTEGYNAYKKGDFADAIFYYTLFLNRNDGIDSIYYQRGKSLMRIQCDSLAFKDLLKFLQSNPERSDVWYDLGRYNYSMYITAKINKDHPLFKNVDTSYILNARHYFNSSISYNPDYYPSYLELASIFHNSYRNFDSCIAIMTKAISRKKNIGYLYFVRSLYFENIGDKNKELEDLSFAIKYRYRDSLLINYYYFWPHDTSMYFSLYLLKRGKIFFLKKYFDKAIIDFTDAINCEKNKKDWIFNLHEATYYRSLAYYELKEYDNALSDMLKLFKLNMFVKELAPKIEKIKLLLNKKD